MRRLILTLISSFALAGLVAGEGHAAEKIRVVASLTDLRSLVEEVGGDRVDVVSLARGSQDPHDTEVRPSLMVKLRRAQLLVRNGGGGDPWMDPLLLGAQNANIRLGTAGYLDASQGIQIMVNVTNIGSGHPEGNPHYLLDPGNAAAVAGAIAVSLKRLAPSESAYFDGRHAEFIKKLQAATARWEKALEPHRGARVVAYDEGFNYFFRHFGLDIAGVVEVQPHIPPAPAHLAALIKATREQKVKVVAAPQWVDQQVAAYVARDSGAKVVVMAPVVDAVKGTGTYFEMMDYNVRVLTEALR